MVHSSTSKRLNGYYLVSARTLTLAASWAQSGKEIRLPACHRPKISWGPRKSTGMATAASPACSILTWDLVVWPELGNRKSTWESETWRFFLCRFWDVMIDVRKREAENPLFHEVAWWHVELWASGSILTVLHTCLLLAHQAVQHLFWQKCHCHKTKALRWLLQFVGGKHDHLTLSQESINSSIIVTKHACKASPSVARFPMISLYLTPMKNPSCFEHLCIPLLPFKQNPPKNIHS